MYGPPGLRPAALYLPLSAVTLVTDEFVGTCVISTVAPPTASPPEETTPEISDVNSCENAKGEMKSESRKILIDLLIIVISSKNISKNFNT